MFRKPSFIGTQKLHNAISKTKYRKQNKIIIIIIIIYKRQKLLQVLPSLGTKKKQKQNKTKQKKVGYIIPTLNCYPRNGQLKDPDFTCHILFHPNQQQYSPHPILWVVLNISTIVLRTRFIRVPSQHPINQVGLTIHAKTSLFRNSDSIRYKVQKPCSENPCLKSADLRQTERLIKS